MTLYERFLRQAKEQIALQDLTQEEVGKAIGLSRGSVSKVLHGKVVLKGDKLLRLAMTLRISLDEIIFPETDLVIDSMTMAQALARLGNLTRPVHRCQGEEEAGPRQPDRHRDQYP